MPSERWGCANKRDLTNTQAYLGIEAKCLEIPTWAAPPQPLSKSPPAWGKQVETRGGKPVTSVTSGLRYIPITSSTRSIVSHLPTPIASTHLHHSPRTIKRRDTIRYTQHEPIVCFFPLATSTVSSILRRPSLSCLVGLSSGAGSPWKRRSCSTSTPQDFSTTHNRQAGEAQTLQRGVTYVPQTYHACESLPPSPVTTARDLDHTALWWYLAEHVEFDLVST